MNHTTQQSAAGCLTLPPVSVQIEIGDIHDATAAADPELLQPATRVISQGFLVIRSAEFSQTHIANSSQFTFPKLSIHAFFNRAVAVDSYSEI